MPEIVRSRQHMLLDTSHGNNINTYLPMELMKEIFLYSIESNDVKSGQLASVCRYWRSVITTISRLWSTLRIESWTEMVQVTTWLQRAYPGGAWTRPRRTMPLPLTRNPGYYFDATMDE